LSSNLSLFVTTTQECPALTSLSAQALIGLDQGTVGGAVGSLSCPLPDVAFPFGIRLNLFMATPGSMTGGTLIVEFYP
jgi:hypothetical protein